MKRREFLQTAAAAASATIFGPVRLGASSRVTPVSTPAPGILDVGDTKQLFLDDLLIAERSRISNFMYRPDKYPKNPIMVADKPWELEPNNQGIQKPSQSALYDPADRLFKMWYLGSSWSSGLSP